MNPHALILKAAGSLGLGGVFAVIFAQANHLDEKTYVPIGITASAMVLTLSVGMWISKKITIFEGRLIVLEARAAEDRATAEKRHDEVLRKLEKQP